MTEIEERLQAAGDRAEKAIALAFEGQGEAWSDRLSGDRLARVARDAIEPVLRSLLDSGELLEALVLRALSSSPKPFGDIRAEVGAAGPAVSEALRSLDRQGRATVIYGAGWKLREGDSDGYVR